VVWDIVVWYVEGLLKRRWPSRSSALLTHHSTTQPPFNHHSPPLTHRSYPPTYSPTRPLSNRDILERIGYSYGRTITIRSLVDHPTYLAPPASPYVLSMLISPPNLVTRSVTIAPDQNNLTLPSLPHRTILRCTAPRQRIDQAAT